MEVYGHLDDEEHDEYGWPIADFSCHSPSCGDPIPFAEDVYVISMYTAGVSDAGLQYLPLEADDGDYLYEPCYFCKECWMFVMDELREHVRDTPPVFDDYAFGECDTCSSGIRVGELFGLVTLGQIQVSPRSPDAKATGTFTPMSKDPNIICIACMNLLERDTAELWGGRITQHDECEEGTFLRCWRYGCPANGVCHQIHLKEG